MKVGDLVVRIWLNRPYWEMVGIIISRDFIPKSSGGAEWVYGVKWNKRDFAPAGETNPFGQWTKKEIKVISENR